ncbi:MAG: hypothetical protein N2111_13095 [Candidatus Sumerlaeaceae bacterium]|nr:hypothetical protein [Candidatus Sumerlaeaceae bacterium]
MLTMLAGCDTGRPAGQISAIHPPLPFSGRVLYDRHFSPIEKPALAKGFRHTGGRRPAQPGVYVCKRVPHVPCGRMMAAMGFYHQWIYTPSMERGVGFVGADYNHFAGLPRPLWLVVKPLAVVDHSGAVLKPDTLVKRMDDLEPGRVEPLMGLRSTRNYFPLANCQRWVNETLCAARRADTGSQ